MFNRELRRSMRSWLKIVQRNEMYGHPIHDQFNSNWKLFNRELQHSIGIPEELSWAAAASCLKASQGVRPPQLTLLNLPSTIAGNSTIAYISLELQQVCLAVEPAADLNGIQMCFEGRGHQNDFLGSALLQKQLCNVKTLIVALLSTCSFVKWQSDREYSCSIPSTEHAHRHV